MEQAHHDQGDGIGPTQTGPANLTVNQHRHWVRIADTCNQRCLFCLDSDNHIGRLRSVEEVEREFAIGRERGCERIIISGGEASVHPKFHYFIKRAREMGYEKVQTVTNGRIWSYKDFVIRAVRAGLSEVTFSMHGHTPKLHDKLVGLPGAFNQAIQGLKYCLQVPGLIVSVDVVICKPNVFHLEDIVRFYSDMGVGEFDLLAMIPFGRGAPNPIAEAVGMTRPQDAKLAQRLLLDGGEIAQVMPGIVRLAEERGLTIWTNRAKPHELEGAEWLIQRPKKLYDEVYGAKKEFQQALATQDKWLPCDDRCDYCFLQQMCDGFRSHRKEHYEGHISHGWWRAEWGPLRAERPFDALTIEGDSLSEVLECLETAGVAATQDLDVNPGASADEASLQRLAAGYPKARLVTCEPNVAAAALASAASIDLAVQLTAETFAWYLANPRAGVTFVPKPQAHDLKLTEVLPKLAEQGAILKGFPFCVAPEGSEILPDRKGPWALGMDDFTHPILGEYGWDLDRFVESHLRSHYMVHSLRCGSCAKRATCPGLNVFYVRDGFGLAELDETRFPAATQPGAGTPAAADAPEASASA
jgi:MoaA/NifB/PqqE/SkfB family radical SAM enzyme